MIDYRAGVWGFHVAWGLRGSLTPRSITMAIPNAIITLFVANWFFDDERVKEWGLEEASRQATIQESISIAHGSFFAVMIFILYNRSRTSYNRWWEGGTLIQKTRGEWFNAYSSIMSFMSTKPEMQEQVIEYAHLLARLMSLLMCCGLQQVSPRRDRPFEILALDGIEPEAMEFLNTAPDKVEVILQWIQRSMVVKSAQGVVPVAPPILSRAFQEVSRGIVNLQNARKIADFPYPYPLAQISMILQLIHFATTPFAASAALPKGWAVIYSFSSIFVLWSIHFNALDLEFPFGNRVNDLPMNEFQSEWNRSVLTLLDKHASVPPKFTFDPAIHSELNIVMSDASELYEPQTKAQAKEREAMSKITISTPLSRVHSRKSTVVPRGVNLMEDIERLQAVEDVEHSKTANSRMSTISTKTDGLADLPRMLCPEVGDVSAAAEGRPHVVRFTSDDGHDGPTKDPPTARPSSVKFASDESPTEEAPDSAQNARSDPDVEAPKRSGNTAALRPECQQLAAPPLDLFTSPNDPEGEKGGCQALPWLPEAVTVMVLPDSPGTAHSRSSSSSTHVRATTSIPSLERKNLQSGGIGSIRPLRLGSMEGSREISVSRHLHPPSKEASCRHAAEMSHRLPEDITVTQRPGFPARPVVML